MADTIGWSCLAGTPVPRLGQGTWYLGEGGSPRKQELAALRTGVEAGMTLIDTAEMYGEGRSEKLVGEAIAPYDREKLFLVSKVYPWNAGEDQIFRSCENTLAPSENRLFGYVSAPLARLCSTGRNGGVHGGAGAPGTHPPVGCLQSG